MFLLKGVRRYGRLPSRAFVIMEERPFIKPGGLKNPQNGFSQTFLGSAVDATLELTKRGAGMTTLFLLVTGCVNH